MLNTYLEFHLWRIARLKHHCSAFGSDILNAPLQGSFTSLNALLGHLVFAETIWQERLKGNSPASMTLQSFSSFNHGFDNWNLVAENWAILTDHCSAEKFEEPVHFTNTQGIKGMMLTGEILMHVIDHASFHCGQLTAGIRALGLEPTPNNMVFYLREKRVSL